MASQELPRQVGPYHVVRELGRGGMGLVLEVRHPEFARPLAMKLMLPGRASEAALARFFREAQVLSKVQHKNVVRVYAMDQSPQGPYMVTDLIEGENLHKHTLRGPLPPRQAARIARDLADALAAIHAQGILHRDLKPENVILQPDGVPVLLDFGLARDDSAERLTQTGIVMGTPNYMAPEQADGMSSSKLDERVDVYGLGGILFTLLGGRPPIEGESNLQILQNVLKGQVVWPDEAKKGPAAPLYEVCRRALVNERDERYPNCRAMARDLDTYLRGGAGAKRLKRKRRLPVLPLVGLFAMLPFAYLAYRSLNPGPSVEETPEVIVPRIEVTSPRDGAVVFESQLAVEGALLEAGGTCDVTLGDTKRRAKVGDSFRFQVDLTEGANTIRVDVADREGLAGESVTLNVEHQVAPEWFQQLPEDQRPPLPLPRGLSFTGGSQEYVNERDGMVLVWVGPAEFWRGTDDADVSRGSNDWARFAYPRHQVRLTRGYFIGKYEVSWKQIMKFCQEASVPPPSDEGLGWKPELPAFNVQWEFAQAYCIWAGLRLPTDAEWELAAKGTGERLYPWGDDPDDSRVHTGSDTSEGLSGPVPVTSLREGASPYGCLNMAGNVAEWVDDHFSRYSQGPAVDPVVRLSGETHVLRNGGFSAPLDYCLVFMRSGVAPVGVRTDHGFRAARSLD